MKKEIVTFEIPCVLLLILSLSLRTNQYSEFCIYYSIDSLCFF